MVITKQAPPREKEQATENARVQKLNRIRSGYAPRVLDLFAGCGGLSLGFKSAGFEIAGAVELDPIAAISHALNFYKHQVCIKRLMLRLATSLK